MAAVLTTERTTRRRTRIAARRALHPACARRTVAPETAPAVGPVALAPRLRVAEAAGPRVRLGDVGAAIVRTGARPASAATFRRRRLVVLIGLIATLAVVGQAGAALGGPSLGSPTHAPAVHRYVARAGDSLWAAASRLAPDEDPRAVVDALVHARGNGPLLPGEVLSWQQ